MCGCASAVIVVASLWCVQPYLITISMGWLGVHWLGGKKDHVHFCRVSRTQIFSYLPCWPSKARGKDRSIRARVVSVDLVLNIDRGHV